MARIDQFLSNVVRMKAKGMHLTSGGAVTLRYADGDKPVSHTTPHDDLVELIHQIAPAAVQSQLDAGQRAMFRYKSQARTWMVRVQPMDGSWQVMFQEGEEEEPELVGAAAGASASAGDSAAAGHSTATRVLSGLRGDTGGHSGTAATTATPPAPARPAPPRAAVPLSTAPAGGEVESSSLGVEATLRPPPVVAARSTAPAGGLRAIEKLMMKMIEMQASDLHLSSGSPPTLRVHGEVKPIEGLPGCKPETLLAWMMEIAPEKNRAEYEERHDTDFAHAIPKVSRFRANYFMDRHGPCAVFRAIPFEIMTPEQLGLSKQVLELCNLTKGLVLITGPTGSGKSTTLATLVDQVNRTRHDHIITIEDPIEFVHDNRLCLVNQREVGTHTRSFKDALRAALREDPDIVLVGELRDLETIAIAVETAETGHLVFGTLHTSTAPSTVDRIIDQFSADRQEQIRQMLAESLRGVVAQTLCRKIGGGRVAAYEVLIGSLAVSNLIREKKTYQLWSLMQTGRASGMVTLNDSLVDLVKKKLVEPEEALRKAVNKGEFRTALEREGIKPPSA